MKTIDEITQSLGQPVGTWDSVSECLEAIKQDPLAFQSHLSHPENLLQLFDADTLRAHQIHVLAPDELYRVETPGKYLFIGGHVTQNHPEAESWFFGTAKAVIDQGIGHGYDQSRMLPFSKTQGYAHDHCHAVSDGQYVRLTAYDDTSIEFLRSGALELYGNANAHVPGRNATVVAHDQTRVIGEDVFQITAKDQSFIVAHGDCRLQLEDQAACVAYGNTKIEAFGKNRVWMMDDNCRPQIAYPETIFCKAHEAPQFRQAIHAAVQSDRSVPELISRLNDLTVAYGPAIRENWDYGEDPLWLTQIKIDPNNRNFVNVPKDWFKHENLYPTVDAYDNVEIQVYVSDKFSESSAMLNHLMEKRGYYSDSNPHTDSFVSFQHWGNAKLFNETVCYEEAVLHKLRPAVQLQEDPNQIRAYKNAGHRGI